MAFLDVGPFQDIVNVNFGGYDILAIYAEIQTDSTAEGAPPPAVPVTFNLTVETVAGSLNFMLGPTNPTGGPSMTGANATTQEMHAFYKVWSYTPYQDFVTDTAEAQDLYIIEPVVEGAWLGPGYEQAHASEAAASIYIEQWRAANDPIWGSITWSITFTPGFVAGTRQDTYGLMTLIAVPKTRPTPPATDPGDKMRVVLNCPSVITAGLGVIQGNIQLITTHSETLEVDSMRVPQWVEPDVDFYEYQLFQFIDDIPYIRETKTFDIVRTTLAIEEVT